MSITTLFCLVFLLAALMVFVFVLVSDYLLTSQDIRRIKAVNKRIDDVYEHHEKLIFDVQNLDKNFNEKINEIFDKQGKYDIKLQKLDLLSVNKLANKKGRATNEKKKNR